MLNMHFIKMIFGTRSKSKPIMTEFGKGVSRTNMLRHPFAILSCSDLDKRPISRLMCLDFASLEANICRVWYKSVKL